MSKTMTLSLGGKERTLDFGKWYFTKYYGEAAGADPLNTTDISINPGVQFDFVVNTVYAGLKTHCKASKAEVDFTRDDVEDWIGVMETEQVQEILNKYAALTGPAGEAVAPENGA